MGTGTLILFLYAGGCTLLATIGVVAAILTAIGREDRRAGRATIVYKRDPEDDGGPTP